MHRPPGAARPLGRRAFGAGLLAGPIACKSDEPPPIDEARATLIARAAAERRVAPPAGLLAGDEGARFVLLGEVPPASSAMRAFAATFARELSERHGLTHVFLEVDDREQGPLDDYLRTGDASALDAGETLGRPDGYRQAAYRALLAELRALAPAAAAAGRELRVLAVDYRRARSKAEREDVMAGRVVSAIDASPEGRFFYYGGAGHVIKAGSAGVERFAGRQLGERAAERLPGGTRHVVQIAPEHGSALAECLLPLGLEPAYALPAGAPGLAGLRRALFAPGARGLDGAFNNLDLDAAFDWVVYHATSPGDAPAP
jgi:erythromycin esterase-like protein